MTQLLEYFEKRYDKRIEKLVVFWYNEGTLIQQKQLEKGLMIAESVVLRLKSILQHYDR